MNIFLSLSTSWSNKACVLYRFPCLNDSDTAYIGKTKRHIATRAKEHVTPKESKKSEVKNHIFECNTCKNSQLSVENFSILKQCKNNYTCQITEALFIKKFRPRLNKQKLTKGQTYLLRVFYPPPCWVWNKTPVVLINDIYLLTYSNQLFLKFQMNFIGFYWWGGAVYLWNVYTSKF